MIWWPTEVPTLSHGLITLRPLGESDIPEIYKSCQDPIIPRFTRIPHDYTMAHAEFFVREKTPTSLIAKTELAFAIDYGNGTDIQFAGVISFHSPNLPNHVAELGYWTNADVRGKGVGTNAARIITNYGFETMGLSVLKRSLMLRIRALKLLSLLGIALKAFCVKSRRHDGHQIDMALYS